jgi:hypothetical protein
MYKKIKKPYADSLYVLGIKNADNYLPTDQEVMEMITQGQEAAKNRQPSPEDQYKMSQAELNKAKIAEMQAEMTGQTAEKQLEYMNVAAGKSAAGIE